ncbi:hypothetical protein [Rhodohalobacter sp. SW132]|uniref:hypothetical protein n=1 Tax=Rhodohalobacter sp. SW132 TaxID=2293433 RepID=UPI0011C02868|nr:hypothetical protein [Rhodohalobacter sp. SW132]
MPKFKIGKPGDRFEQQADRVTDAVMRMPDQPLQMQPMEEEEELQMAPAIQRQESGETEESEAPASRNPLTDAVSGILREQLSEDALKKHLKSLGKSLRDMAAEGSVDPIEGPAAAIQRLTTLNIPQAFQQTSQEIIRDPALAQLRQQIIDIVGRDDRTAMLAVLAAGLAAFIADVDLSGEPSVELGAGFTVGGMFDFGSAQDIEFNQVRSYVQYANSYFRGRVTGGLEQEEADDETGEEEQLVGTGTGEIRVGTDINHLMLRGSINSNQEITLTGRLSGGPTFGNTNRLVFTADVSHMFATGETVFRPSVSGRFNLGRDQRLEIGTQLQVSSDEGLNRLTGFVEYQHDRFFLRFEGNIQGFQGTESISPGNEIPIQLRAIVPFDF